MGFFNKIFGKNKEVEQKVQAEENLDSRQDLELEDIQEGLKEVIEECIKDGEGRIERQVENVEHSNESTSSDLNDDLEVEDLVTKDSGDVETPLEVVNENEGDEEIVDIQEDIDDNEPSPVVEENEDSSADDNESSLSSISENEPEEEHIEEKTKKKGFIKSLFRGLTKTRDTILNGVDEVLSNFRHIDEDLYEELEEALIMADFGVETTMHIMDLLKKAVKEQKITDPSALKPALQKVITDILMSQPPQEILSNDSPTVILVIGVNGVGKTTSIGKMSHLFKEQNKKVLVAAADTFRAAAIEQLQVWVNRAGVELIKHEEGTDAAAVVFDAISAAKARKSDVLICDTAGRLQNKTNLMKELEKISRIIAREYPDAKKEILIVLDATTGQNAIQQVKLFKEVADINGIILTKLDGTAKGGSIVGIYETLGVPVKYIGVGEQINDLQPFDAKEFANALFSQEQ